MAGRSVAGSNVAAYGEPVEAAAAAYGDDVEEGVSSAPAKCTSIEKSLPTFGCLYATSQSGLANRNGTEVSVMKEVWKLTRANCETAGPGSRACAGRAGGRGVLRANQALLAPAPAPGA